MSRYRWAQPGDINAFFGLMLDNVAVMVLLVGAITTGPSPEHHFNAAFVLTRMIPGTALGVVIGDVVYTVLAFRLARRTGRSDVTAMPLGLDTPSTFAVALLVLLPVLRDGQDRYGLNHEQASLFAWHVGAVVLVLSGIFKTLCAPVGNAVRRWVPRAGLLGSLAAVALALIAFLPLLLDIAALPVVGVISLAVILVTLVAHQRFPGNVPGALAAVIVGIVVYYVCQALARSFGWPLVPLAAETGSDVSAAQPLPLVVWDHAWWSRVWWAAAEKLPVVLPFALATVVGGIDCTESAAAAGDEYDTRSILWTEAIAAIAAGLAGGVIQTTPYIGQPAYKAMGGRAAYTLATALFIGGAAVSGLFTHLFDWLPRATMFPILVYVGLEITAQSFRATPTRHYPAVALAILPALAYLATIPLDLALGNRSPVAGAEPAILTLRCLANGFLVTSLLWAAALAALIDGALVRAAMVLLIAGACTLVGIIHSPLREAPLALPDRVVAQMPPAGQYQTPYHWAAAYGLTAILLLALAAWGGQNNSPKLPELVTKPESGDS
jgi:adenine/guanine/hypoxanthine permease